MVNKEMKFLDNGDIRYEIVDASARSNIQTINTVLDTKADTSNVTALDTRVTRVEDDYYKPYVVDTASGAVASFADGADGIPLKSLVVDINPVQSGSGDPSPDNVRPISGWTGAQLVRTGKNLFDGTFVNLGIMTADAVELAEDAAYRGMYSRVVGGNTYTVSRKLIETNRFRICATIEEPANNIGAVNLSNVSANDSLYSITVTVPEGYNYLFVYLSNDSETCTPDNYQIELGSTATEYEPYAGQTIPINWQSEAGTVYGGSLDVLSGVLTVDRAMVDLGTLNWVKHSEVDGRWTAGLSTVAKPTGSYDVETNAICERYNNITQNRVFANNVGITTHSLYGTTVFVYDPSFPDAAAFKSAMNGVMLCYELATPITYQLITTEVKSLLGQNHVWADSGDTEVIYRADTKLFIERLTAPDSADMIADSNIVSGQYFMVSNALYKATTNIANDGQIIVGTNCTKVSLATALNEINQ